MMLAPALAVARRTVAAAALLGLAALPALAEPDLAALLDAVPPAAPGPGQPAFAYARLDILAGRPGPAPPGATRAEALSSFWLPLVLDQMTLSLNAAGDWPARLGFDLDAVDAVLVANPAEPVQRIRILSGADRMRDAGAVGTALAARGFLPLALPGGPPAWSRGEDGALNLAAREVSDPFSDGMGKSQRIALLPDGLPPGLAVAGRTSLMAAAAQAWSGGPAMGRIAEVRAVAQLLSGPPGGTLVHAIGFPPVAHSPDLAGVIGPGPSPSPEDVRRRLDAATRQDGPALPTYGFAGMGELRDGSGGRPLVRIVLAYAAPEPARAALDVMAARVRLAEAGPKPYGAEVAGLRTAGPVNGVHLAVMDLRPLGSAPMPLLQRWTRDFTMRRPLPFAAGAVPDAAWRQ